MQVADLAKELKVSSDDVLLTLKALKLKAKDSKQELSSFVISVVKSELAKPGRMPAKVEEKPAKAEKVEKVSKAVKVEKTEEKKGKAVKAKEPKVEKTVKATAKAKVEKKVATKEIEKKEAVKPPAAKKEEIKEPVIIKQENKSIISKDPIITLKPLLRKKKRIPGREEPKGASAPVEEIRSAPVSIPAEGSEEVKEPVVEKKLSDSRIEGLADLEIKLPINIKDFSVKVQQKPSAVLGVLLKWGIFANINQNLDQEILIKLANHFGFNLAEVKTQEEQLIEVHKKQQEDPKLLKNRAPVVTFMGHVDHGKTSLLDYIRKSKVADSEHGGITQHIGAYSVVTPKGKIAFLDTPGHEAFTAMRSRGAQITDIVVLVVAADEGVMPQTEEAMNHAKAANVPIVVALNKIDKKNADPERVKKQLLEHGLTPEDWGGKTVCVGVSAVTGAGIDQLLEMLLLESEMLELKANFDKSASGIIVDAHMSRGKGSMATMIVQSGTLKEGDIIVVGPHYGRIKAMFDDHERPIKEAGPSTPVEILGLPEVPQAGDSFYVVPDEKQARTITEARQEQLKNSRLQPLKKFSLEDLMSGVQQGSIKELNLIIKADVQGSLEAIKDSLGKIPSDKVKIKFIHSGVGDINNSDIILAVASQAIIIGFHVNTDPRAKEELEKSPVDIRNYRIIYDAVNDIRNALTGMLEPKARKKFISRVEVRQVFKLSRSGIIAGCYVSKGKIHRKAQVEVLRNGAVVHSGNLSSLKRFKDDVREVNEGMECGISIQGFDQVQIGDIIEAFELEMIAQKL